MEAHRCNLCSCGFVNGRALCGHIKSHLPPRPAAIYGLRENPRKNIKFSDPQFSFSASGAATLVVVQDGESEAESWDQRRRRRKRRSGRVVVAGNDDVGSLDAEPVSSVSDTSPEEDVAMCLMMLSRDDGGRNPEKKVVVENREPDSVARKKQPHQCEICKKWFRSSQSLGGHRIIHRKKAAESKQRSFQSDCSHSHDHKHNGHFMEESSRIFDCPFCGKVFGSGQALGGHKRSPLTAGGLQQVIVFRCEWRGEDYFQE
ncbi:hypothetical protein MLD38_019684 [Melastoma candidum]|uniref:Uncharacterized protein n=1 Tax=Melastoma candidum TaxID=119954 RepID=A0ACB9R0W1_9MYRT|nr:hypothetical protein MLD38_019684 [Melastoma candidum]